VDRAEMMEMLKSLTGSGKMGKTTWQWDIEGDVLTIRHYEGKPDETIPHIRQWRLVPIGGGH
jgi:hypothetical protein